MSKRRKIGIRTEGGHLKGMGHIMRCMALYEELKENNIDTMFFIKDNKAIVEYLKESNISYEVLYENRLEDEIKEFKGYIDKYKLDTVITDSYWLSDSYLIQLKAMVKQLASIDDNNLYNYPSDVVINYNIYANTLNYKNKEANYLLGPSYCILRKEFREDSRYRVKKEVREVLITMGGSDINNFTPLVIDSLKDYKGITLNVIVGKDFKNIDAIKTISKDNVKLIYNPSNMKDIMIKNDLAISSSGCTTYELASLGIPTLLIPQIDNQVRTAIGFDEVKISKNLGMYFNIDKDSILKEVAKVIKSYEERERMSALAKTLINKNGVKNIVKKLLKAIME